MIEHTRKSTYILWLLIPILALVMARSLVHTKALDNHPVSKQQSVALALSEHVSVHAAGRGNPYINLLDGHDLLSSYVGEASPVRMLQQGQAHPASLTSADFDEDGVPDLVSGYSSSQGGLLAFYRGNVDSIFPNAPEAKAHKAEGSFVDSPFFPSASVFEGPEAADFLEAGDFDGDGHWDVVTSARGSALLHLFSGNGRGDLKRTKSILLPGVVTAVVAGEVNRRDGLTDLAVGTLGLEGPQALVFESPLGALRGDPEVFSVPAEVTAMAMGQLDDGYPMDVAVATGSELLVIHGRDRKLSLDEASRKKVSPALLSDHSFELPITSIAVGNFTDKRQTEIAVLLNDGKVQVVGESSRKGKKETKSIGSLPDDWSTASRLVRAKVSSLPHDDLILVDQASNQIHILGGEKEKESPKSIATSLDMEEEPVAVLPMRLNVDALQDLVVLKSGQNNLTVAMTAPMTTFVVNSAGDGDDCNTNDGVCSLGTMNPQTGQCTLTNECTLKAATQQANASAGLDAISFAIGSGTQTILSSGVGATDPVIIDGTTQPGFSGTPIIELNGTSAPLFGSGLYIRIDDCTVRGLIINRFEDGILLHGPGRTITGNKVEGNFIGTDLNGTADLGNDRVGVYIVASNNTIGGPTVAARNIISGNRGYGVVIAPSVWDEATGNEVQGNFIGTDLNGAAHLGNGGSGVWILTSNNTIGGTTAGTRNIISGNGDGIRVSATANIVQGNYIGTDVTGTSDLGNSSDGVSISGSHPNNIIGGTITGARNIISGNDRYGIVLFGSGNQVQGNYIGTDVTGTADLGNAQNGVSIFAANNTIGGITGGARNIISGNDESGIQIYGSTSTGNQVQGNYLGTDVNGTADLGNTLVGVLLTNVTANNTIGPRNVISGNNASGIEINTGATSNTIQGNYIGTDVTGTVPLGNFLNGVLIIGAPNNTVGGTTSGARNIISGNALGVGIVASSSTGNRVQGNFIGTDVSGSADIGNKGDGITIAASNNLIGGTNPGAPNIISGNKNDGIEISGSSTATGNQVQGNFIGTQANGTNALPNTGHGIFVTNSASSNAIGGTNSNAGNTIQNNGGDGVFVASGAGNAIVRNSIFANVGLGIDLGSNGVTPNDPGDGDSGANNLQNFPVVDFVFSSSTSTTIWGMLTSRPNTAFTLHFYSNDGCDSSGSGEGQKLIGATAVTTRGDGTRLFKVSFSASLSSAQVVTATATDAGNNTSEFSACSAVFKGDSDVELVKIKVEFEKRGFENRVQPIVFIPVPLLIEPTSGRKELLGSRQPDSISTLPLASIENVKIELSRNGGATFGTLFASTPNDGSECWLVTGPATTRALIRVSSTDNPAVTGVSEPFEIVSSAGGSALTAFDVGPEYCGDLGTGDGRSQIRGNSFYADRYSFFGSVGQQVTVSLTSPSLDTYLYLLGPDGSVIAQDNDGGGATDARIPAAGGFFTLPATGTYVIEATSFAANALGDYQLRLDSGPLLLTAENTERATALDSVLMIRDPFPLVSTFNFSSDHRTRLSLFAVNLELLFGENSSVVTAQAEDSQHRVYPLTVEYVGRVPNFGWLTQINVRLPDELANAGDVWVSTSLRGVVGNRALINVR